MDKGLTVPKRVLINQLKIPQMPQNVSAQIVYPSPKVWDFNETRLHCVNTVRRKCEYGVLFITNAREIFKSGVEDGRVI
jgi:hypothetical protein